MSENFDEPSEFLSRFNSNLPHVMQQFEAQVSSCTPVPRHEGGPCLMNAEWRGLTEEESKTFAPTVFMLGDTNDDQTDAVRAQLVYFHTENRSLRDEDAKGACSMSLESMALCMTNPRIPLDTTDASVTSLRDYASRTRGPKLPWNDSILPALGDVGKIVEKRMGESDINSKPIAVRAIEQAARSLSEVLLALQLPSVSDVVYCEFNNNGHRRLTLVEIDRMTKNAPMDEFSDCTRGLAHYVTAAICATIPKNFTHQAFITVSSRTRELMMTLCNDVLEGLVKRYVSMRYAGAAIMYDGAHCLLGYLACCEPVALSSIAFHISTASTHAVDLNEMHDFTALSHDNVRSSVAGALENQCAMILYAMRRYRSERVISTGLRTLLQGDTLALRQSNVFAHALFTALAWRWFCLEMVYPIWNVEGRRHVLQTAFLTPFGDTLLSSNTGQQQTPHELLLQFSCAFSCPDDSQAEFTLPRCSLRDVPKVVLFEKRPYSESRSSAAAAAAPASSQSDEDQEDEMHEAEPQPDDHPHQSLPSDMSLMMNEALASYDPDATLEPDYEMPVASQKRSASPEAPVPVKKAQKVNAYARRRSAESLRTQIKRKLRERLQTLESAAAKRGIKTKDRSHKPAGRSSVDYRDWIDRSNRLWTRRYFESMFFSVPAVAKASALTRLNRDPSATKPRSKKELHAAVVPMTFVPALVIGRNTQLGHPVDISMRPAHLRDVKLIDGSADTSVSTFVQIVNTHTMPADAEQATDKRFSLSMILAIHFYYMHHVQNEVPRIDITERSRRSLIQAAHERLKRRDDGTKKVQSKAYVFKPSSPYYPLVQQLDSKTFHGATCFANMERPHLHSARVVY